MQTIKVRGDERMADICAALAVKGVAFNAYQQDGCWIIEITGA